MHHPYGLHLHHQLVLREGWVLSVQPRQPLRSPQLLDVDVFEQGLKVSVALYWVAAGKCPHCVCASRIDVAKQFELDLIDDGRTEKCRIQISLNKRPRWRW